MTAIMNIDLPIELLGLPAVSPVNFHPCLVREKSADFLECSIGGLSSSKHTEAYQYIVHLRVSKGDPSDLLIVQLCIYI